MSFWKKLFKIATPIVLGAINPYLGAAVGAGMGASGGGGITGALTGAAGGYFGGSALSGGISGFTSGAGAGTLGGAVAGATGSAANAAGTLGSLVGLSGSTVGTASNALMAANALMPQKQQLAKQALGGPVVAPEAPLKRPGALERPASISEMANFAPEQERSALATRGINTGLGEDENAYYRNLIQRSLIGDGNQVKSDNPNFLMPIESQFFSRQGKNTGDIVKFLQGIR